MSPEEPCFACRSSFHNECESLWLDHEEGDCCCGGEVKFNMAGNVVLDEDEDTGFSTKQIDNGYITAEQGFTKNLADYTDPISTGRKKAAQMYPINAGMVCEWAGLAKAGGGVAPIIGCIGRAASDRHHGPDKNTMNNAPANLHRVCDHCHNTWHAHNDPAYGERPEHTKPFIPVGTLGVDWFLHDSKTKATTEEVIAFETKRLNEARG